MHIKVWDPLAYETLSDTLHHLILETIVLKIVWIPCPPHTPYSRVREVKAVTWLSVVTEEFRCQLSDWNVCASPAVGLFCCISLWYVVWRPILKVDVTSSSPFWLKDPLIYLKHPLMKPSLMIRETSDKQRKNYFLWWHSQTLLVCAKLVTGEIPISHSSSFTWITEVLNDIRLSERSSWEFILGWSHHQDTTITGCHTWNCANPVADWVSFRCLKSRGLWNTEFACIVRWKPDSKSAWNTLLGVLQLSLS